MNTIEIPDVEGSAYTVQFGIRLEPELKEAIEEVKSHAKKVSKKDVNEAIRIQLRMLVKEYWAQVLKESA